MDTSKAAAALGKLGGKAGTGEAKRRGDSAYYKALRAKRTKPLPKSCGRPHPQPYCCCLACEAAR